MKHSQVAYWRMARPVAKIGLFHTESILELTDLLASILLFVWFTTRSTRTVHISAKARITSVAIRIRIRIPDKDRHQNLIVYSSAHCRQTSLKISCKAVRNFCAKFLTSRQTQTNN